jgi:hypothetical protein
LEAAIEGKRPAVGTNGADGGEVGGALKREPGGSVERGCGGIGQHIGAAQFVERPVGEVDERGEAVERGGLHEPGDLALAVGDGGDAGTGEAARFVFAEEDRLVVAIGAGSGFDLALEHEDLGAAVGVGDHREFGAEIYDLDGGVGNAEADGLWRHRGGEGAAAEVGVPGGVDIEGGGAFEHDACAGIEGDLGAAGGEFEVLALAEVFAGFGGLVRVGPAGVFGCGQAGHVVGGRGCGSGRRRA